MLPSMPVFSTVTGASWQPFALVSVGRTVDELQNFCCQNPDCADYGVRGHGNLRVAFRYGPAKDRRCLACREPFEEFKAI